MAVRGGRRTGAGRKRGNRLLRKAVEVAARGDVDVFTAQRVLEEIAALAFSDVGDVLDANGTIRPIRTMAPKARRAIASIKTSKFNKPGTRDGIQEDALEIRLWSKVDALKMAAQFHALLVDVQADGTNDKAIRERIKLARARVHAAASKGKK